VNIATEPLISKVYPDELKSILERAVAGDQTVIPQLKAAFDQNPEFVKMFGDLVHHAEESLLTLSAGNDLFAKEAIRRQLQAVRQQLKATSALENLLVDRIAISWLEVYQCDLDLDLANLLQAKAGCTPAATHAERRLNSANQRFLASVRALVTAQKLLRPALSPIQIAMNSGNGRKSSQPFQRPAMGKKLVGVEN
jgi:hypothetical protein